MVTIKIGRYDGTVKYSKVRREQVAGPGMQADGGRVLEARGGGRREGGW